VNYHDVGKEGSSERRHVGNRGEGRVTGELEEVLLLQGAFGVQF